MIIISNKDSAKPVLRQNWRKYSAEGKIRILLEGLRGEERIVIPDRNEFYCVSEAIKYIFKNTLE